MKQKKNKVFPRILTAILAAALAASSAATVFARQGTAEAGGGQAAGDSSQTVQSSCQPTEEQVRQYKQDGSWEQRCAFWEQLGNEEASPQLIQNALRRGQNGPMPRSVPEVWQSGMPATGEARVLLLQVDFPNYSFEEGDTLQALEQIAFGGADETSPYYPYESLKAYYSRSSYGKLQIDGEAVHYTAKYDREDYNVEQLFEEALNELDGQLDYSDFDGNGDGVIDAVYLHFAGLDTGWGSDWWSVTNKNSDESKQWDGVLLGSYVTLHSPSNEKWGAQTLIHETGHVLGLPDYYSYKNQSFENGIRTFDMMNNNTGDHDGFSKWLLGWLDDGQVLQVDRSAASGQTIALSPLSEDTPGEPKIAVISPEDNGAFSEYLVVQYDEAAENQSVALADGSPLPNGFRVFHVNASLNEMGTNFRYTNYDNESPKLIELVDPDGEEMHCNDTVPYADGQPYHCMYFEGDSLTPQTNPASNFYGGKYLGYTGIRLTGFQTGEGASFSVSFDDAPPVPGEGEFVLTPESWANLSNQTNYILAPFTASLPFELNDGAEVPVLKKENGEELPLSAASPKALSLMVSCDAQTAFQVEPNTDYTLVFPAGYFYLGAGCYSEEITVPIHTAPIARIQQSGEYGDYLAGGYTAPIFLSDGTPAHFSFGMDWETGRIEQVNLYCIDQANRQTVKETALQLTEDANPFTAQAAACYDGTVALALHANSGERTYLYKLSEEGELLAGPAVLPGKQNVFACGNGVKAYPKNNWSQPNRVYTVDFLSEPTWVEGNPAASYYYRLDGSCYGVTHMGEDGFYLSVYSSEDTLLWSRKLDDEKMQVSAFARDDKVVVLSLMNYVFGGTDNTIGDLAADVFDKATGEFVETKTLVKSMRFSLDNFHAGFIVQNAPGGIALLNSTSIKLGMGESDTVTDYYFLSPELEYLACTTGINAFYGSYISDRYAVWHQGDGQIHFDLTQPLGGEKPVPPQPDPGEGEEPEGGGPEGGSGQQEEPSGQVPETGEAAAGLPAAAVLLLTAAAAVVGMRMRRGRKETR